MSQEDATWSADPTADSLAEMQTMTWPGDMSNTHAISMTYLEESAQGHGPTSETRSGGAAQRAR
ncbi:MAG TPA: hypothetical protein VF148_02015 [Acidimicrobiia bacterium]